MVRQDPPISPLGEAGKSNTPNSDAINKDSLALEIDTHLAALIRKARNELENHLDGLLGLDIFETTESHANEIRRQTQIALNSLRENSRNGVNALFPQRKKIFGRGTSPRKIQNKK